MRIEFVLDLEFGVVVATAVVDPVIANITLHAVDPGDNRPGTVIMRRCASTG